MTIYLLICKSGSSIHLDFFFLGGGHVSRMRCSSVNASPPPVLPLTPVSHFLAPLRICILRCWCCSAIVWWGKIYGLRWNTCGDLTAATTRRWTKNTSIIWIIIRRVNAPRDFIRKSRALGFDCLLFGEKISSFHSPTQRADLTQVASLLLGFVAGKFPDHAPNLPPKLGKRSEFFGMRLLQFVLGEPCDV